MNLLLNDINTKETIEIVKNELIFLKTYINHNLLENYISLSSTSIIQTKKNHDSNHDKHLLISIEKYDYHKKMILDRIQTIQKLDYPFNALLFKKYVEKKQDDEINEELGFSDSTRKRRMKDAYLQYAFQSGIIVHNKRLQDLNESFENDVYQQRILEFCIKPKSRSEIQTLCDINSRSYFTQNILKPLVKERKLLMTHPNNPKSKLQRYYTNI